MKVFFERFGNVYRFFSQAFDLKPCHRVSVKARVSAADTLTKEVGVERGTTSVGGGDRSCSAWTVLRGKTPFVLPVGLITDKLKLHQMVQCGFSLRSCLNQNSHQEQVD